MVTVRDEAEMLALGLDLGVVRLAEVVDWAYAVIARSDRPHWSIGELCIMGRAYGRDVANALRQIPGEPDLEWARRALLERLPGDLRARDVPAEVIGAAIELLYAETDRAAPQATELRRLLSRIEERLELLGLPGVTWTRGEVIAELLAVVELAIAAEPPHGIHGEGSRRDPS